MDGFFFDFLIKPSPVQLKTWLSSWFYYIANIFVLWFSGVKKPGDSNPLQPDVILQNNATLPGDVGVTYGYPFLDEGMVTSQWNNYLIS